MGWLEFDLDKFPKPSEICKIVREDITGIDYHGIQTEYNGIDCYIHLLKDRMCGYTHYCGVVEINFFDDTPSIRYITHAIINVYMDKGDVRFGCKIIDETAGPEPFSCPISYINMCTAPLNEYARLFRNKIIYNYLVKVAI